MINLIFLKVAKDEKVSKELQSQIPSLCYLFYIEKIFTEEFIQNKLVKNAMIFKNTFYGKEVEDKFLVCAKPFTHWFENAPFEDEEGEYKGMDAEPKKSEIEDL